MTPFRKFALRRILRIHRRILTILVMENALFICMIESIREESRKAGYSDLLTISELRDGWVQFIILIATFLLAFKIQNGAFSGSDAEIRSLRGLNLSKIQYAACRLLNNFLELKSATAFSFFYSAAYFIYLGTLPDALIFLLPFLIFLDIASVFLALLFQLAHRYFCLALAYLLYFYLGAFFIGIAWDFPDISDPLFNIAMKFGGSDLGKILAGEFDNAWPIWTGALFGASIGLVTISAKCFRLSSTDSRKA